MYRLVASLAGNITIETLLSQDQPTELHPYRILLDGLLVGEFDTIPQVSAFLDAPPRAAA